MKQVLLSFDIEEFDTPLEYGRAISLDEQISFSADGTGIILDILLTHQIRATFFSTVVFASHATNIIHRIKHEGHELASHGVFHSDFKTEHLTESKLELEKISGSKVVGFRMPRMMHVAKIDVEKAGYFYDSSLNPIYLPGRYSNFFKPRTLHKQSNLFELPASATPIIRFPLFWLSFHNLPLSLYKLLCLRVMNHDSYLNIYFHPWEFGDLKRENFGLPKFVSRNSGQQMVERFTSWIKWMKAKGYSFTTIHEFIQQQKM